MGRSGGGGSSHHSSGSFRSGHSSGGFSGKGRTSSSSRSSSFGKSNYSSNSSSTHSSSSHSSSSFGSLHSYGGVSGTGRSSIPHNNNIPKKETPKPKPHPTPPPRHTGYIPRPSVIIAPTYHTNYSSKSTSSGYSTGNTSYNNTSNNEYDNNAKKRKKNTRYVIIALSILIGILVILLCCFGGKSDVDSTKQREKLQAVVNKTDWYIDDIGWITSPNVLISGLEDFYSQTGVQPYVLFVKYSDEYWNNDNTLNSESATNYLENFYNSTFSDEGHFIFAYFECMNDTKSEMDGEFLYLSGYSADTIMDTEALSIFWGYFETNYYNTTLSIEQMISNTFSKTAKSIMSAPTNGWDVLKVFIIVMFVILIIVLIYYIIQSIHERQKEKEKYTKEILDKPLDTFGTDTSDLENKYNE